MILKGGFTRESRHRKREGHGTTPTRKAMTGEKDETEEKNWK